MIVKSTTCVTKVFSLEHNFFSVSFLVSIMFIGPSFFKIDFISFNWRTSSYTASSVGLEERFLFFFRLSLNVNDLKKESFIFSSVDLSQRSFLQYNDRQIYNFYFTQSCVQYKTTFFDISFFSIVLTFIFKQKQNQLRDFDELSNKIKNRVLGSVYSPLTSKNSS